MSLAINGGDLEIPLGTLKPSPAPSSLDRQMVLSALDSVEHGWGKHCEALQQEWALWNGNDYCIALNSGTSALHLTLAACGASAGDEIIVPAYSWASTVTCVLHQNCVPVFVDVEPRYGNIDPSLIEAAVSRRTRAIIAVHLHGVPSQIDEVIRIAKRHDIAVIEDACQAHGSLYHGQKVGTFGHAAAFSLNQNKILSAGEGGLFVTQSEEFYSRARSLIRFDDFSPNGVAISPRPYGMGWMYRYQELPAAHARAQLSVLDDGIAHARKLADYVRDAIPAAAGLSIPCAPEGIEPNGYALVCHVKPDGIDYRGPTRTLRDAVVKALCAEGVWAQVWQPHCLPELSVVVARGGYGNDSAWATPKCNPNRFPNARWYADSCFIINGLRLPNTLDAARLIARAVTKVFEHPSDLMRLAEGNSTAPTH